MFRKIAIGFSFVLGLGIIAAGCDPDDDEIIFVGGSDLSGNTDVINGLTTIASNNLAPDGGGLSQNGATASQFQVVFNCDCCDSDGTFAGDNSALILFEVTESSPTKYRLYASHYDGSTLTPPVQLFGDDHDETVFRSISSFVCIPINTSGYTGDGSGSQAIADTRANAGNWLILGDHITHFRNPVLNDSTGGGNLTTTNARGPRRALQSWVFVRSLRDTPTTTHTLGSVTHTFRHGFQETSELVNSALPGGGAAANNVPSGTTSAALAVPPNHLTSYGAVTDTFCGTARFSGRALPFSQDGTPASSATYEHTGVASSNATAFAFAIPYISQSTGTDNGQNSSGTSPINLNSSDYVVGDATNYISAVWTQVCNSFSGGGSFTSGDGAHAGGHELQLRYRTFNLATMTWESDEAQIGEPAARNTSTTTTSGTAPFTDLLVHNNFLFFKYADASLSTDTGGSLDNNLLALTPGDGAGTDVNWFQRETGGYNMGRITNTGAADQGFWEEIIAVQRFGDDGDGTTSLAGTAQDVSSDSNTNGGSFGTHTLDNPTVVSNGIDTYPADREIANFNGSLSILGPDQGMSEVTLFYVMADNSNTTANPNIDLELCAVVLNTDGTPAAGVNPSRVSGTSVADFHEGVLAAQDANAGGTGLTLLEDPIVEATVNANFNGLAGNNGIGIRPQTYSQGNPGYFNLCLNRTGEWAGISYLKDTGLSSGANNAGSFHQALWVIAYQPFRSTAGTTGSSTAANVEARFTAPQEVNQTGLLPSTYTPGNRTDVGGIPQALTDAETSKNWDELPVNKHVWQGKIGYRCGFQSNKDVITIFFEQSDSTSDRVWARQMTITPGSTGTPTLTFTAAAAELDASDTVQSFATFFVLDGSTTRQGATSYPFIDREITLPFGNFKTCDAGLDASGNAGQVLVVYDKYIDNTNADGDLGDKVVRAALFDGTTFTVQDIGIQADENAAIDGTGGAGDETDPTSSSSSIIGTPNARSEVRELVCVPNNSDIVNAPSYPTAANETAVYIYFTEPEATPSTTGGTTTVTTNASRRLALYTRKYTPPTSGASTTFAGRFTPDPTGGGQPLQIDHDGGISDDVTGLRATAQNGRSVGVVFEASDQLWLQNTSDGVTYIMNGAGLADPKLITNRISGNVGTNLYYFCKNGNDDVVDGVLLFRKDDQDGDDRAHVRTGSLATAN